MIALKNIKSRNMTSISGNPIPNQIVIFGIESGEYKLIDLNL